MADVNINKFRASVVRDGSKPSSPGFIVSEGQDPVDPAGNGQNHLPVTIATAATGLSITDSQVLGGAGTVGQYIRGDGSLADFPQASGGGSSVSYYLNGSISQGTIGGVAYKELNKVPILGAGTDFTINADGYIASFLTDAGDPNLLEIPGGNWNFETYFSASSSGGTPTFYVELYKYDGTTFTLIASSSSSPELIAFGTNLNPYFSTLAVPTTTLALTDRLAIRYYVTHSGRTITLHTENNHLCQVVTTFTTGLTSLNGLTAQVQNLAVGTSGTDFNIASATATHTFNLPTASATNRGALSSADWTTFNNKQNALTNPVTGTGTTNYLPKFTGSTTIGNSQVFDNGSVVGIGNTGNASYKLLVTGNNASIDSGGNNTVYLSAGVTESFLATSFIAGGPYVPLSFEVGGSKKMTLFTDGNLLIQSGGTFTNNNAKLQVTGTATIGAGTQAINTDADLTLKEGVAFVGLDFKSARTAGNLGGLRYFNSSSDSVAIAQQLIETDGQFVFYNGTSGAEPRLTISSTGVATFSNSVTSSFGSSGANFNSNAATTGSVNAYRASNSVGVGSYGIEANSGNNLMTGGLANATLLQSVSNTALQFGTNQTARMTITSSGNVGIGTASPNAPLTVQSNGGGLAINLIGRNNAGIDESSILFSDFDSTTRNAAIQGTNSGLTFFYGPSTTLGMRLDGSGNVGIGTASPLQTAGGRTVLTIDGGSSTILNFGISGTLSGYIYSATSVFGFYSQGDLYLDAAGAKNIISLTNGVERARITSAGYSKFSNNGSYTYLANTFFEVNQSIADWTQVNVNKVASGTPLGLYVGFSAQSPNNTSSLFILAQDSTVDRFAVRSNGGIANYQANNVNLSDIRTKKEIEPLESYWNKFKAIEIVKFKYKDQTHDDFNIGVIAQQVEKIAPEFIDIEGWGKTPKNEEALKSVYSSDLHHATIKVLQEAMAKIESLQKEIDTLKN